MKGVEQAARERGVEVVRLNAEQREEIQGGGAVQEGEAMQAGGNIQEGEAREQRAAMRQGDRPAREVQVLAYNTSCVRGTSFLMPDEQVRFCNFVLYDKQF